MSDCGDQWLACMITGLFAGITLTGLAAYGVRHIYNKCRKPIPKPSAVEVIVSPFAGAALGISAAASVSPTPDNRKHDLP